MSDTKISDACERCSRCREGDFANCKNALNLAEASRDALPFVAYAYSQGIEGAEEAGRAVESALEDAPLHPQPAELAEQQGVEKDAARWRWLMDDYYGGQVARANKVIGGCFSREAMEQAIDKDLEERR